MPINPPPNKEPMETSTNNASAFNQILRKEQPKPISDKWQEFFSSVYTGVLDLQSGGKTTDRPTKRLYIGRTFFDTSLGIPIWYNGTDWIDATGVVV